MILPDSGKPGWPDNQREGKGIKGGLQVENENKDVGVGKEVG